MIINACMQKAWYKSVNHSSLDNNNKSKGPQSWLSNKTKCNQYCWQHENKSTNKS